MSRVRLLRRLHPEHDVAGRDGYDLVIGVGFAQGDAVGPSRRSIPETKFAIIDVDQASFRASRRTSTACSSASSRSAISPAIARWRRSRQGQGRDQRGRRHEGAARRSLHRRLFRRRREGGAGDHASSTTPRTGTTRRSARSWRWTRSRAARRSSSRSPAAVASAPSTRRRRATSGDRRRRGPVVPRPVRDHERPERGRLGRLAHDRVDSDGNWKGGGNETYGLKQDGVGLGKVSPVCRRRVDKADERARRSRTARSPTSRPPSARENVALPGTRSSGPPSWHASVR